MENKSTKLLKAFLVTSTALGIASETTFRAIAQTNTPPLQTPVTISKISEQQKTPQDGPRYFYKQLYKNQIDRDSQDTATNAPNVNTQTSKITSSKPRATVQQDGQSQPDEIQPDVDHSNEHHADEINTIIVTGSHIRGIDTSVGTQVISIGKEDIDRAGYSNVRDIFENLPQNVGSSASIEYQPTQENSANTGKGSTINLRGLGSTATLILINGRRLPAGGYYTDAVDASVIPIAAIDRIEILPDGASAVYGSDAVAGVVNFILKKDYEGFETRARYGSAFSENLDEYQFSQTAGWHWTTGNVLIAYEFNHRDALPADELEFTRSADFRSKGGRDRRLPYGFPPNIIDPITLEIYFAIPQNQNGQGLTRGQLLPPAEADITELSVNRDLMPELSTHKVFFSANQQLNDSINFFTELRFNRRDFKSDDGSNLVIINIPQESPYYFDAFGDGRPLDIAYSFHDLGGIRSDGDSTSYGLVAGLTVEHASEWQTEAFASFNREDVHGRTSNFIDPFAVSLAALSDNINNTFNPFDTLTPLQNRNLSQLFSEPSKLKLNSYIDQYQAITSGPLFKIGARDIKIAAGLDYRQERFKRKFITDPTLFPADLRRRVGAAFGEVYIPLVQQEMDIPAVYKLELSGSLRHEWYKDKSVLPARQEKPSQSSTDPRIGILWTPTNGLNVRGSYGTSFRAPGLRTLTIVNSTFAAPVPDPQAPFGATYSLVLNGPKPLTNETAETWTAGIELAPIQHPSLRLSINYFEIEFSNQITTPNSFTALSDPALSGIVIRNPTPEQIADFCKLAPPERNFGCARPDLIRAIIDSRTGNFATSKVSGFDLAVAYAFETGNIGIFSFGFNGSYLTDYTFSVTPETEPVNRLDRPGYPIDFRARASLSWSPAERTTASIFANYADQYRDPNTNRTISSHTTIDLTFSHDFTGRRPASLLDGLSAQLTATNLFNNAPPFYENEATRMGYDPVNAEPIGRFIALTLTKRW